MGSASSNPSWQNFPSVSSPISAKALNNIELGMDRVLDAANDRIESPNAILDEAMTAILRNNTSPFRASLIDFASKALDNVPDIITWEEVRRNRALSPIGGRPVVISRWIVAGSRLSVDDDGMPVLQVTETVAASTLYTDPTPYPTGNVGDTIRWSADVKTSDPFLASTMRATVNSYLGGAVTVPNHLRPIPVDQWTRIGADVAVTASPAGSYFRTIVYPSTAATDLNSAFRVRKFVLEVGPNLSSDDSYFDGDTIAPAGHRCRWLGTPGDSESVYERQVRIPA